MDIFSQRFPTKSELWQVFTAYAVPIHIWAIIATFIAIPSWILSMTVWGVLSTLAYPLVFALFESLVLWSGLVILAVILPGKLYKERFVSQSGIIVLMTLVWGIVMQIWGSSFGLWTKKGIIWLVVVIGITILLSIINSRSPKLQATLNNWIGKFGALTVFYLVIDGIFLIILLYNNFLG